MTNYVKTVWKNLTAPAINETHLNKIEQGIFDATEQTLTNKSAIDNIVPTGKTIVYKDTYATAVDGGTLKAKTVRNSNGGTDLYWSIDGTDITAVDA